MREDPAVYVPIRYHELCDKADQAGTDLIKYMFSTGQIESKAGGSWQTESAGKQIYINQCDILTKLIQWTGRYVEHYASDLFITWTTMLKEMNSVKFHEAGELHGAEANKKRYVFALRESGVDHDRFFLARLHDMNIDHYYRKIFILENTILKTEITSVLKSVSIPSSLSKEVRDYIQAADEATAEANRRNRLITAITTEFEDRIYSWTKNSAMREEYWKNLSDEEFNTEWWKLIGKKE